MVFRKKLRSLERRWEKISKFLGDLPSEQIFYRNIPLGAPVKLCFSGTSQCAAIVLCMLFSILTRGYAVQNKDTLNY